MIFLQDHRYIIDQTQPPEYDDLFILRQAKCLFIRPDRIGKRSRKQFCSRFLSVCFTILGKAHENAHIPSETFAGHKSTDALFFDQDPFLHQDLDGFPHCDPADVIIPAQLELRHDTVSFGQFSRADHLFDLIHQLLVESDAAAFVQFSHP